MKISYKKPFYKRKKMILPVIIILVALVGGAVWAYAAQVGPFAKEQAVEHESKEEKVQKKEGGDVQPEPAENSKEPSQNTAKPPEDFQPTKPTGTFVSNHSPNLSGSPAPNQMSSICQTTPGVFCTIQFTKGGVVKSLPQKKTDSSGSANWDWKLQDIGLTVGDWSIEAVAKNGDKINKAQDAMSLRVSK